MDKRNRTERVFMGEAGITLVGGQKIQDISIKKTGLSNFIFSTEHICSFIESDANYLNS